MSSIVRFPRILSHRFEEDLLAGILHPLLALVQRDRDLIAEIRTNLLDIYCKGQRLISVQQLQQGSYRFESDEKFWNAKNLTVSNTETTTDFCYNAVPFIKQRIAEHGTRGREIEFEQLLVRANNLERLNTDYIAVDRQGISEEGRGRTDVVGVYWPSERRTTNTSLAPALIEVKYGLTGGVEDVADQIARYFYNLQATLPAFTGELEKQLHQKARLGLLSGLSEGAQAKIQRLPVSDQIEDVRAVIALVDYNPRSSRLNLERLAELPFASQVDLFHLGFGLWRSKSTFQASAFSRNSHIDPTSDWVEEVRRGNFAAIPQPFRWIDSIEFAHLIDGRRVAEDVRLGRLGDFANMKASLQEVTGQWDGTATELWLCLFYEHRRARHSGEPEVYSDSATELDALCTALRNKLQTVGGQERARLLTWLASNDRLSDDAG